MLVVPDQKEGACQMFLWKRRNDHEITKLLKSIIIRLDDLKKGQVAMASIANAKLDQIKETLITAGAGVNTLIANNRNLAAAVEELRSQGVDVSKLDDVYNVSTGIATTVAAALTPSVPTPPVTELPEVTPLPDLPPVAGDEQPTVPETSDPVADLPTEAPAAETPAETPSETPATDAPSDSAGSDAGTTDGGSTSSDSTTS